MFKTQRKYQSQGCLRAKHIYNLARLLYQISPEGRINGIRKYEAVIGLEVHAQLATESDSSQATPSSISSKCKRVKFKDGTEQTMDKTTGVKTYGQTGA